MSPTSWSSSSGASPTLPKSSALSFATARSKRRRPLVVISTSVARASVGWDTRRQRPAASEAVDRVGHGARGDPQAVAHRAERHRTGPPQHAEHLVAGERELRAAAGSSVARRRKICSARMTDTTAAMPGGAVGPALLHPALSRGFDRVVDEGVRHGSKRSRALRGLRGAPDHAVRPRARPARRRSRRCPAAPPRCARPATGRGAGGSARARARSASGACCAVRCP